MISQRYEKIKKIGEGSYGEVHQVQDHQLNTIKAIKQIKYIDEEDGIPNNAIRQITILDNCDHPNILKMQEVIYEEESAKLYIVLQFLEYNLTDYSQNHYPFPHTVVKNIMFRILEGLYYLHTHGIMHRDLKPQNILIDTKKQLVCVCDFGQSKILTINQKSHSCDVGTLWYRAPQILLESESIDFNSDIWSIGCIFSELATGKPLIQGTCELGQIFQIFRICGTPSVKQFPSWKLLKERFPKFKKNGVKEIEQLGPDGNDLLQKMIQINPSKRIGVYEALRHSYFNGY